MGGKLVRQSVPVNLVAAATAPLKLIDHLLRYVCRSRKSESIYPRLPIESYIQTIWADDYSRMSWLSLRLSYSS
jgi:hypothetical protein